MEEKKMYSFRLTEDEVASLRELDPTGQGNATNGIRYLVAFYTPKIKSAFEGLYKIPDELKKNHPEYEKFIEGDWEEE